jgi:hypothetical protein
MAPVAASRLRCFSIQKASVDQVDVRESVKPNQFVEPAQFFCNAAPMHSQYKSLMEFGAGYLKTKEK